MSVIKFTMEGSFLSKVKNVGKITMLKDTLNDEMVSELNATLDKAEKDENVRCLVLASEADNFCTAKETTATGKALLERIRSFPVPIIGMITGQATGAGFDLALATDFRFSSDTSELGWAGGGLKDDTQLKQILGPRSPEGVNLLSAKINAKKAQELGIVNRVLSGAELKSTVMFTATKISDNAPIAVRHAKACISLGFNVSVEEANKAEVEACMKCMNTEDILEGVKAVFQKRKAQFKGK